jgi:hypothetical protein
VHSDEYSKLTGHSRDFLLEQFPIAASVRSATFVDRLKQSTAPPAKYLGRLIRRFSSTAVVNEQQEHFFWEGPSSPPANEVYLKGYWQAAGYAAAVERDLRTTLTFANPTSSLDRQVLDRIATSDDSVSIHVRRGDYLLNSNTARTLPTDYYDRAIGLVTAQFAAPTFFVFSDDITHCRNMFPDNNRFVFVDHNPENAAVEDMRLMAACRHHIIANSSFSWWGAWLGKHPTTKVYAPRHWVHQTQDTPDIFPAEWQLLDY